LQNAYTAGFVGIRALGSRPSAIALMAASDSPALRASSLWMNHSCWQVQRRAVTSTASSVSLGGKLALPAQVLAERLQVARERRVVDERDERAADFAARAGADQRRHFALLAGHRFGE
jgi:hypothetical protein